MSLCDMPDANFTNATELTRRLVQIESTDPGVYEGNIEQFIKSWLEKRIAMLPRELTAQIQIEELEALPDRTELMATIPGTTNEPRLVFICHMDTVVIGQDWDADINPLGAEIRDRKIYGRGSCDMKSGLACAMTAFASVFQQVAAERVLPSRGLSLICTVDEEAEMAGVEAAIHAGWVGSEEWVLDCEPTDGMLQIAHKGRTWFELTMNGFTAHASKPEQGADAIAAMAEAIGYIHKAFLELPTHAELGRSTVTFGQIEGGYQPYVVPDKCTAWIDMRLVPPCNTAAAEQIVKEAITHAEQTVPGNHGNYVITGDRPPIERDPASPLAAAILNATKQTTGAPAEISAFTGYTDTAVIAGKCNNHNCMSYGPGSLNLAHKPNEYVEIADIERVEAVLKQLCKNLLWQ